MEDYGRCPENPILLKNISDSILFMDSLISTSGNVNRQQKVY
jgi:hypothetical protein